jgi:hypothetical protein
MIQVTILPVRPHDFTVAGYHWGIAVNGIAHSGGMAPKIEVEDMLSMIRDNLTNAVDNEAELAALNYG